MYDVVSPWQNKEKKTISVILGLTVLQDLKLVSRLQRSLEREDEQE